VSSGETYAAHWVDGRRATITVDPVRPGWYRATVVGWDYGPLFGRSAEHALREAVVSYVDTKGVYLPTEILHIGEPTRAEILADRDALAAEVTRLRAAVATARELVAPLRTEACPDLHPVGECTFCNVAHGLAALDAATGERGAR
jgi:hypothetical protein